MHLTERYNCMYKTACNRLDEFGFVDTALIVSELLFNGLKHNQVVVRKLLLDVLWFEQIRNELFFFNMYSVKVIIIVT